MDSSKKMMIAGGVLVVLLGATFLAKSRRTSNDAGEQGSSESGATLPEIDADAVTEIVVTRPDEEPITLRRPSADAPEDAWRVLAGELEAPIEASAIRTALEKLGGLESEGVVAMNSANHERLEVDDAHAVAVTVKAGDDTVAEFLLGAYRGGQTMMRLAGEDTVIGLQGSVKHAFNKAVSDWRNKRIVNVAPERVLGVRFVSTPAPAEPAEGEEATAEEAPAAPVVRAFTRGEEWTISEGGEIERFGASRVQGVVATLARARANGFAAADVTASAAGFDAPVATVTLTVGPEPEAAADAPSEDPEDGEAEGGDADGAEGGTDEEAAPPAVAADTEEIVIDLGGGASEEGQFYLRRRGDDTIYTVSRYTADRVRGEDSLFQTPEPGSMAPSPTMMPAGFGGPGGPGGLGGGMGLPPEIMEQLQRQLQQQGM